MIYDGVEEVFVYIMKRRFWSFLVGERFGKGGRRVLLMADDDGKRRCWTLGQRSMVAVGFFFRFFSLFES